jgi:hypothetical protein
VNMMNMSSESRPKQSDLQVRNNHSPYNRITTEGLRQILFARLLCWWFGWQPSTDGPKSTGVSHDHGTVTITPFLAQLKAPAVANKQIITEKNNNRELVTLD